MKRYAGSVQTVGAHRLAKRIEPLHYGNQGEPFCFISFIVVDPEDISYRRLRPYPF